MAGKYAEHTEVPIERSVAEIERTLNRYGCEEFSYARRKDAGAVEFVMSGRRVRVVVPLPEREHPDFTSYVQGRMRHRRAETEITRRWQQACNQRWRALLLVIKAKLEAVEAGISTFDAEWLAQIVLPGGPTVGDVVLPQVKRALELPAPDMDDLRPSIEVHRQ